MAARHAVIADDSKRAQQFVRSALISGGIIVDGVANNGEEALALCREFKPDIALLDFSMPGKMNGLDAARAIKAENLARYVFLVSSNMQTSVINQGTAIGAHVVGKVNDAHALLAKLSERIPGLRRGA